MKLRRSWKNNETGRRNAAGARFAFCPEDQIRRIFFFDRFCRYRFLSRGLWPINAAAFHVHGLRGVTYFVGNADEKERSAAADLFSRARWKGRRPDLAAGDDLHLAPASTGERTRWNDESSARVLRFFSPFHQRGAFTCLSPTRVNIIAMVTIAFRTNKSATAKRLGGFACKPLADSSPSSRNTPCLPTYLPTIMT